MNLVIHDLDKKEWEKSAKKNDLAPEDQYSTPEAAVLDASVSEAGASQDGIRPARMEHAARYGAIYAKAFSGEPWNDPWEPADAEVHVRELLESKQSYGLEYIEDGEVAGFLIGTSMLFHYGRVLEINDLAVDPAHQGKGIARELLERCIADMKERGMAGLNLITGAEGFLPEFYEKHGFSKEERVILMGREL